MPTMIMRVITSTSIIIPIVIGMIVTIYIVVSIKRSIVIRMTRYMSSVVMIMTVPSMPLTSMRMVLM